MTLEEKLEQKKQRIELIKKWPKRLAKLLKRKEDPLDEAAFCERYGFEKTYFNRMKNLKVGAKQDKVNAVEEALTKEGV